MATITLTVEREGMPLDLLLWEHFRREVPGLVERTLAQNYGLAALGTILPVGTRVRVEAPAPAARQPKTVITLWTTAPGE